MLPQVFDQQLVHLFRYWHQGIRLGMRHGNELYAFVRSYPARDRLSAYELACELAELGNATCVTRSEWRYTIWISLRAPLMETPIYSRDEEGEKAMLQESGLLPEAAKSISYA